MFSHRQQTVFNTQELLAWLVLFFFRLVVFNETFASLKSEDDNICVLWNESIRGRNAADVTSAYYNFITKSDPKITNFVFWVDNCSAQNKNWTLFSSFVIFVNADWGPQSITLKFSFMSADSVHGQISQEMKIF